MPVAVHAEEPRFLFFWNHKVASRSLLHALEATFPETRFYPQSAFRPPAADGDWVRLMLVRDPWARVASCYRNKCRDAREALVRNGALEPCQRHLLAALGAWPCRGRVGADRLGRLSFAEFTALLPIVRDGNSHFRRQTDALLHASPATSRGAWAWRTAQTVTRVVRTHYLMPRVLRARRLPDGPCAGSDGTGTGKGGTPGASGVHVLRLEDLPDAWSEAERLLGMRVPMPWHARTARDDDWKVLYGQETIERVGALYAADAAAFGYAPPDVAP